MHKLKIRLTKEQAERVRRYQEAEDKFRADIERIRKKRKPGESILDRLVK